MAMPRTPASISTIEELLALLADGLRHELLDGVHVVTPAPELPHQGILGRFYLALAAALAQRDDLAVYLSPADVVLGPKTSVQPDLFVVRKDPGQRLRSWREIGVPVLAIEILSPNTASCDRGAKRRIYQRVGVAEYWIVDPDARLVERWRPGEARPEIVTGTLEWRAAGTRATVPVDVAAIFDEVLGAEA